MWIGFQFHARILNHQPIIHYGVLSYSWAKLARSGATMKALINLK